ncbi:MAG: VOC family protein [Bryobacteraceae bacterium]|jgi:PhnB protein
MRLNTHLSFNGKCEAAFRFYEQCLGAKIVTMMTYAGSPMEKHVPPEERDKILHATLTVGETELMGADAPPGRYEKPVGFQVALHFKDPAEAERVFQALAENGTVHMPLQKTFWASRFGMLTDPFDIPWMINCE